MKTFQQINRPLWVQWQDELRKGDSSSDAFHFLSQFININFSFGNNPLPTLRNIFPEYDWKVMFLKADDLFEPFEDKVQFLFNITYILPTLDQNEISDLINDPEADIDRVSIPVISVSLKRGVPENRCAVFIGDYWKEIEPTPEDFMTHGNIMYRLREQRFAMVH